MSSTAGSDGWYLAILWRACSLLPGDVRERQFTEWRDEIQCAEECGLPAGRRVISIALRSVPRLAWRARRSSRGRAPAKNRAGRLANRLPKYFQHSWALAAGRSGWTKTLTVASAVVVVDLASKAMVSSSVFLFEQHPLPHLTIFRLHNPGLSMTFIGGGFHIPALLAIVGGGIVLLALVSGPPQPRLWLVIGLMLGGSIGNLSERLYHGYVTDFLQIGTIPAVFNLADVAIGLAFALPFLPRLGRSRSTGGQSYRRVAPGNSHL